MRSESISLNAIPAILTTDASAGGNLALLQTPGGAWLAVGRHSPESSVFMGRVRLIPADSPWAWSWV